MVNRACRCWAATNVECLLLALLVMHTALECTVAGPADPGESKRKAQSTIQNTKNQLAENNEQDSGQSKKPQDDKNHTEIEKSKENLTQKSEPGTTDAPASSQSGNETGTKKNGGNKAAAKGSKNDDKKKENEQKDVELKNITCKKTSDCAPYNDTACVQDKGGQNRCLCGNGSPPRNMTFCKNIRRYVTFPCNDNSQCIPNAECKLGLTNQTKPQVAHLPDGPTASICWCKDGFNSTEDNAQCLDEWGLFQVMNNGRITLLQDEVKIMKKEQEKMESRLKGLEGSGQGLLPSITITVLMSASILVVH